MENTHDVVQKAGEWDVLVVLSLRVLFRQEKWTGPARHTA